MCICGAYRIGFENEIILRGNNLPGMCPQSSIHRRSFCTSKRNVTSDFLILHLIFKKIFLIFFSIVIFIMNSRFLGYLLAFPGIDFAKHFIWSTSSWNVIVFKPIRFQDVIIFWKNVLQKIIWGEALHLGRSQIIVYFMYKIVVNRSVALEENCPRLGLGLELGLWDSFSRGQLS